MKDIIIETYKDGDETGMNSLFNKVFNQDRDLKEWEWKFKDSPIDSRKYIVVAKDKDLIVGQYPCMTYYLKYRDRTAKIAQPIDNVVHEDYRGGAKGTQVEMFLKEEEIWRNNGIDMAFGFPNREAYIVGKRFLKYRDLIKIENLSKRLSFRLAFKRRINVSFVSNFLGRVSSFIIRSIVSMSVKPVKGVEYRWTGSFDKRIDLFWNTVSKQYDIMVKRDYTYLDWRYSKKPGNDYHILQAERDEEIVGILVVKYEEQGDTRLGFIMECLTTEEPRLRENLIAKGLIFLARQKTDHVFIRVSHNDPVKDVYNKMGFLPKECIYGSNFVHKIYSPNVDVSVLTDTSVWHISFGDCDSL